MSPTTELMLDLAPGSEDIALLSLSRVDTRDTESEGADNKSFSSYFCHKMALSDNKSLADIIDILGEGEHNKAVLVQIIQTIQLVWTK